MLPDISIVVPIYNVEKYLPKCIDSLISQTYTNIEIILVDDGSPDHSGQIADEYSRKDSRITVIHQKNKWLGGARNSGIKQAQGKYILFLDSDDYISQDSCEKLLEVAKNNNPEVILFDHFNVDRTGNVISTNSHDLKQNMVYDKTLIKREIYPIVISSHEINSACMKMYRTDTLKENAVFFDEEIRFAEDYEFVIRLLQCLNSFMYFGGNYSVPR